MTRYFVDDYELKRSIKDRNYYMVSDLKDFETLRPNLIEKGLLWQGNQTDLSTMPIKMQNRIGEALAPKDVKRVRMIIKQNNFQALSDLVLGLGLTYRCTSWLINDLNGNLDMFELFFALSGSAYGYLPEAKTTGVCTVMQKYAPEKPQRTPTFAEFIEYLPKRIIDEPGSLNIFMAAAHSAIEITPSQSELFKLATQLFN